MPSRKPEVLIIGAGPTGLMAASLLAQCDISIRIVDSKSRATTHSNAAAMHARTLEAMQSLDLADTFIKQGIPISVAEIYKDRQRLLRLHLKAIASEFNFLLSIPQNRTEKILTEALMAKGYKIERNTALTAVYPYADHVDVILENNKGEREKSSVKWLLGCDGAHSAVRALADIDFPGEDFDEKFLLADVKYKRQNKHPKVRAQFSGTEMVFSIPLPNNNVRIIGNIPPKHHLAQTKKVGTETVQTEFQRRLGRSPQIESVSWSSFFWIHSKMSSAFRKGPIFLLGDAAHIHSPVGGQGMNTGLQDALNLCWKLALVIQGRAPTKLLASYAEEREPVARSIVSITEKMTELIASRKRFGMWLKTIAFRTVNRFPKLQSEVVNHMAQLDYSYKDSSAIYHDHFIRRKAPAAGERFPNVEVRRNHYLHRFLKPYQHTLLIFVADCSEATEYELFIDTVTAKYKDLLHPVVVNPVRNKNRPNDVYMNVRRLDNLLHICHECVYLVRPDQHIAYCQNGLSLDDIMHFLQDFFIRT